MDTPHLPLSRRTAVGAIAGAAAAIALRPLAALARAAPATKPIPSTGERLPVIGLGTWITFNVGDDRELRDECATVMRAFFQEGGRVIDSSPMLFVAAVALYPLLAPALGRGWRQAEVFGLMPDQTALGTIGLLLVAKGGLRRLARVVPLLWCVIGGLTLWAMASEA